MHTDPVLDPASELPLYHEHLQTDHDFKVWAEVLSMEEEFVGEVDVLDGQINFTDGNEGPDRTGSVVLSDPEGALSFGTTFARDDTDTLWVNRLIRIRHSVVVPTIGEVVATCMVGVPTSVGRQGGSVSVEMGDKSLLMDHGVRGRTFKKGMNVHTALVILARDLCGEHRYTIPTTGRRLSKTYSVGMGEDALTPWQVFRKIAYREMRWRSYFAGNGWLICEQRTSLRRHHPLVVRDVLALPESSTSFTDFINYVKVTSHRKPTNKAKSKDTKKSNVTQIIYEGVGVLPASHDLSEQSLARYGVLRTLPLVVTDDDLKTKAEVADRVKDELQTGSGIDYQQTYEIVPFFHLDNADKVTLPLGIGAVPFTEASIPLGVGGNMTIGRVRWVSAPTRIRRVRVKQTVKRRKKKGGKKNG